MKNKMIVMPLQPGPGEEAGGIGLGIHFLLGNMICLNPGFLECWFGWRVKKIFPGADRLMAYCRGGDPFPDINGLGAREKVRFWMEGRYFMAREGVGVELVLHDTRDQESFSKEFILGFDDGMLGFCRGVLDWLDTLGLGWKGSVWSEHITRDGLDCLGNALEGLYLTYVDPGTGQVDLTLFERAATLCPGSYLCQDLLGWGLYKNDLNERAAEAFADAAELNPDGMGALAGLMWCALAEQDREKTLHYALEKGRCRGEDPEKARAFVVNKFS